MESLDDILLTSDDQMSKCMDHLRHEFAGLRTGKASAGLVENISVSYYGTMTRLRELASIATPEPRLIVIKPYDPTALTSIEKAIAVANLGIAPVNDGKVVRLPIPELSGERRAEISKIAKRLAEENRVSVRTIRRDANEAIKKLQKDGKISEDERDHGLKEMQTSTDDYIKKIDEVLAAKEKEIMAV